MIGAEECFVVAPVGSSRRWVVRRPVDLHGDGYVHSMLVEISDEGLTACGNATFEGRGPETLRDFLVGLADSWRGWPGVRSWTSLEDELTLDASHDGLGHVTVAVTLRGGERAYLPGAWSGRVVFTVEAGEELRSLARAAEQTLQP